MDPLAFLDVAALLTGQQANPSEEARSRSAIGRAYYALYNVVIYEFFKLGINLRRDPQAHTRAYRYLLNSGIPEAKGAGKVLDDLREDRNDADYEMRAGGFDLRRASLAEAKARQALQLLSQVDKQALAVKVLDYRKNVERLP